MLDLWAKMHCAQIDGVLIQYWVESCGFLETETHSEWAAGETWGNKILNSNPLPGLPLPKVEVGLPCAQWLGKVEEILRSWFIKHRNWSQIMLARSASPRVRPQKRTPARDDSDLESILDDFQLKSQSRLRICMNLWSDTPTHTQVLQHATAEIFRFKTKHDNLSVMFHNVSMIFALWFPLYFTIFQYISPILQETRDHLWPDPHFLGANWKLRWPEFRPFTPSEKDSDDEAPSS